MWQTVVLNDQLHIFRIDCCISDELNGPADAEQRSAPVSVWLSDFRHVWLDSLTLDQLLARSKLDNALIEYDEHTVINTVIREAAAEFHKSTAVIRVEASDDEATTTDLRLRLKTYVSGMPFHFHWNLRQQTEDVFYSVVTKSLLVHMLNVQHQCTELLDVIRRKDIEIDQYKLAGAEILRTHLATTPFDQPAFLKSQRLKSNTFAELFTAPDNQPTLAKLCEIPASTTGKSSVPTATTSSPPKSPEKRFSTTSHLSPTQRLAREARYRNKISNVVQHKLITPTKHAKQEKEAAPPTAKRARSKLIL